MAKDVTVEQLTSQRDEGVKLQEAKRSTVNLKIMRGEPDTELAFKDYSVEVQEGMVVLDAVHAITEQQDPTLACRWNCKAGKCGSCSAEINGVPRLMCMTRLDELDTSEPITVEPVATFPLVKDLVTDVSWNYEVNKEIQPFTPGEMTAEEKAKGEFKMSQEDVDRLQEFRKCIECFLCQDVCHVLRNHQRQDAFYGPRFMIRIAGLEMHPKDVGDRLPVLHGRGGVGMCNITKCCTEVCPENINITDNGIIPMKERVVTRHYDPVALLWRKASGKQ